jgi:poly-gamma-glutamate synthesis protein (capsule biosynthesis protein)
VLVYYSLGNFVSAQVAVPRALGGMARITLEVLDGQVNICYNTLDFTVTYFTAEDWVFDNFKVYMLREFPQELLSSYGIYQWIPDFTFQEYMDVVYQMNPDWQ